MGCDAVSKSTFLMSSSSWHVGHLVAAFVATQMVSLCGSVEIAASPLDDIEFNDTIRTWTHVIQQLPVMLDSFLDRLGCPRQSRENGKAT